MFKPNYLFLFIFPRRGGVSFIGICIMCTLRYVLSLNDIFIPAPPILKIVLINVFELQALFKSVESTSFKNKIPTGHFPHISNNVK